MDHSTSIKQKAASLGFDACGIARSRAMEERRAQYGAWLEEGRDGGLGYMSRNLDKRFDPAELVPGARSVIVCAISYNRGVRQGWDAAASDPSAHPRIATYAWGGDYHDILKAKLKELLGYVGKLTGGEGRTFVDTAPILEKPWAVEAGLGWIGRNSLLIHPELGSFLLLGVIVTTAELEPDYAFAGNGCRTCRKCVESCPVGALRGDRMIDARRCIARRTIEEPGPGTDSEAFGEADHLYGWVFGCDICQEVCPHNRYAPVRDHDFMTPVGGIDRMTRADWQAITEAEFAERFGNTPLTRCGLERIKKRL